MTLSSLAIAALVWRSRPDSFQNRALALVLALFGLMGFGSQGLIQLTDDRSLAYASQGLLLVLGAAVSFVYLAFVGTLPTPLARPFAGTIVRRVLLGLAVVAALAAGLLIDRFVSDLVQSPSSGVWMPVIDGRAYWLWYLVAAVVFYGFLAALSMLRRAPPDGPLRTQALLFATAFGVRDAWYMAALAALPLVDTSGSAWIKGFLLYQFPSLTLFLNVLLGYGILRYQMFDIDLRIKWTIRRGTVAAVFLAVFFIVATVASEFLTGTFGFALGGVAAGLLLFALAPLQRFVERLANRAMPTVRDTDEYRLVRKREVYRAAVESALQDQQITDKERDVLATLADQLGLSSMEALRIEREAAV